MKQTLFIFSFILSWLFSGSAVSAREHYERFSSASAVLAEAAARDDSDKTRNIHSNAILPTRPAGFSGEDGEGSTSTVRSNSSVRRNQVSQKYPFRIIKAGKVIDRQHFFVFQTTLFLFPSGTNSISRYIHIICQLLI